VADFWRTSALNPVAGSETIASTDNSENSTVTDPPVRKKVWVITSGCVVVGGATEAVVVVGGAVAIVDVVVLGSPAVVVVVGAWASTGDEVDVGATLEVIPEPAAGLVSGAT